MGTPSSAIEIVSVEEFSQLLLGSSQTRKSPDHQGSPQIHRVPPQLRLRRESIYDPVVVSLGPYHHGKPELHQAEEFKHLCLDWSAGGNEEKKASFYNKILEKIDVIRGCYAEVSIVGKYNDKALALMMLLDACFIIKFMEHRAMPYKRTFLDWRTHLGVAASIPFTTRDIILLENQIPFLVIKMLISLIYEEKQQGEELIQMFLCWMLRVDVEQARIAVENGDPPLHILEACRRILVNKNPAADGQNSVSSKLPWPRNRDVSYTCRPVMDLKAKGIEFSPSSSQSLKDITFRSGTFYGHLQLPVRYVSHQTQVMLSNMIAYEMSPHGKTEFVEPVVFSYTNFMKSLIESPEDVKELQENGILFNRFADAEQVVKLFKEIDTFGLMEFDMFRDVKHRIGVHCDSRPKTWIADLIRTRFKSPWTVIALLAATFLLVLTFLQTWFTIHPVK